MRACERQQKGWDEQQQLRLAGVVGRARAKANVKLDVNGPAARAVAWAMMSSDGGRCNESRSACLPQLMRSGNRAGAIVGKAPDWLQPRPPSLSQNTQQPCRRQTLTWKSAFNMHRTTLEGLHRNPDAQCTLHLEGHKKACWPEVSRYRSTIKVAICSLYHHRHAQAMSARSLVAR